MAPRETDLSWARGGGLWRGEAETTVASAAVTVG